VNVRAPLNSLFLRLITRRLNLFKYARQLAQVDVAAAEDADNFTARFEIDFTGGYSG